MVNLFKTGSLAVSLSLLFLLSVFFFSSHSSDNYVYRQLNVKPCLLLLPQVISIQVPLIFLLLTGEEITNPLLAGHSFFLFTQDIIVFIFRKPPNCFNTTNNSTLLCRDKVMADSNGDLKVYVPDNLCNNNANVLSPPFFRHTLYFDPIHVSISSKVCSRTMN